MKTLISWLAYQNDFIRDKETGALIEVNLNGPNYGMHKHFYDYDRHILLHSGKGDETGTEMLKNVILEKFPDHIIEPVDMEIGDVIDLAEIKPKVEAKLMEIADDEIDIFFSPGTSAMQVTWYICHTTLNLSTRLIQTRPAQKSKIGKPELLEIDVEKTTTPITSVLKEISLEKRGIQEDYLITDSIKPIYDNAEKIAQTDKVTVLIQGETGTGKENLARHIHDNSIRKHKPYITINCSAFHDQLLESRLFGYVKGAFTGADKDTKGLFEQAEGGTIFLDEIGDISPYMQQALLRVIHEKEIQPIGGKAKKVNVRIITATNKNLTELCQNGKFRWDLYYRLAVTELELPSLQERGTNEIKQYLDFLLKKKQEDLKKDKVIELDKETIQFLLNYPWPGNIRELENLVETLYVYYDEKVTIKEIPERFKIIPEEKSLLWKDIEKKHIEKILKLKKGNQRQACIAIGYKSINTFVSRLKEHGIQPDVYKTY